MLDELYQDIILQAARDTRFRGSLSGQAGAVNVRMHNPLCGDSLDVWMTIDAGRVRDVRFEGHGCLISQAAANLFAREVQDLPVEDATELCRAFRNLILTEASEQDLAALGQLTALSGIRRIPARSRCALLSCEAIERIIDHRSQHDPRLLPFEKRPSRVSDPEAAGSVAQGDAADSGKTHEPAVDEPRHPRAVNSSR